MARHFLACVSADARGESSFVEAPGSTWPRGPGGAQVELAGEGFTASGLMVLERNYLDVYPFDTWRVPSLFEKVLFSQALFIILYPPRAARVFTFSSLAAAALGQ